MTANRWSVKEIKKAIPRTKAERGLYFLSFTNTDEKDQAREYRCWLCGESIDSTFHGDEYCANCSGLFYKQNVEQRKHVQNISGKTVAFVIPVDENKPAFEIDTEKCAEFMKKYLGGNEWYITPLRPSSCSGLEKLHFAYNPDVDYRQKPELFNRRATDAVRFLGYRCELRKLYGPVIILGPKETNEINYLTLLPREIDLIKKNMIKKDMTD